VADAFDEYARAQAEHTHPEHHALQQAAKDAEQRGRQVRRESSDLHSHLDARLLRYEALAYADDPEQRLAQTQRLVSDSEARLAATGRRIDRLTREPALASQAPGWLECQHDRWRADDAAETTAFQRIAELRHALAIDAAARERMHAHERERDPLQHDMGRHGPSFGR
jgi:endonuclease/exonuclease/phosphatase (EEP) superfamily protein YafD